MIGHGLASKNAKNNFRKNTSSKHLRSSLILPERALTKNFLLKSNWLHHKAQWKPAWTSKAWTNLMELCSRIREVSLECLMLQASDYLDWAPLGKESIFQVSHLLAKVVVQHLHSSANSASESRRRSRCLKDRRWASHRISPRLSRRPSAWPYPLVRLWILLSEAQRLWSKTVSPSFQTSSISHRGPRRAHRLFTPESKPPNARFSICSLRPITINFWAHR